MSLENSIAELAKAVNRYVDTMLVLGSQPPAASNGVGSIRLNPNDADNKVPVEETPPAASKKVKKTEPAGEPVSRDLLKAYAMKRVRENPGFRYPFLSLLSEYGADTVADLAQEHLADVSDKAKLL